VEAPTINKKKDNICHHIYGGTQQLKKTSTHQLKQMRCGSINSSKKIELVVVFVEAQTTTKFLRSVAQKNTL
jgi:homoserine kinase